MMFAGSLFALGKEGLWVEPDSEVEGVAEVALLDRLTVRDPFES